MASSAQMARHPSPELVGAGSKKLLSHSLAALLDQALLSGLNFALGLILIRLATKQLYGVYSQIYVAGIFASTVIEALITGPLTTIAPGKSAQERERLACLLLRFQWQLSIGLAILFGLVSVVVVTLTKVDPHPFWLGGAFAFYIFANAQREYHRSINFIEARLRRVLHTDIIFVLVVVLGMVMLLLLGLLSVATIFLVLGLANIAGMWRNTNHYSGASSWMHDKMQYRAAVSAVMQRGRWALPGALVAWATNYSYLYLAAALLGVAASADLNASRLLLIPISLSVLAWSRVARPIVSRLFAARDWKHLDRLAWASVVGIEFFTIFYVIALWLALPWLQAHVLGDKYHGLEPMVLAWGGYFAINAARWIGSSWLTSNDQYKLLLFSSIFCLVIMLISAWLFIPMYGAWGAILALIIVEVFDLMLIWLIFLPMLRRGQV